MIRQNRFSILLSLTLAAVAVAPAAAFAGERPAAAQAPRTSVDARFSRYLLAPNGRAMGLLLQDGSVVHLGRASMVEGASPIPSGATIHIDGVAHKSGTATWFTHAIVSHDGKVVADGSKHHRRDEPKHRERRGPHGKLSPMSTSGAVSTLVAGPRGKIVAIVLDDGTTAMGAQLDSLGLKAGDRVTLAGKGGSYAQGKALRVERVTMPDGTTRDLPAPQHRHHDHGQKQPAPV